MKNLSGWVRRCGHLVTYLSLLTTTVAASAATLVQTDFSDGNDNLAPTDPGFADPTPNSYGGSAGNGWIAGWSSYNFGSSTNVSRVSNWSPMTSGGGNYLQYDFSSSYGSGVHLVRGFASAANGGIDTNLAHTISFKFRLDSDLANRSTTDGNDYIRFYDNNFTNSGSSSSTSWWIQAAGDTNSRRWTFVTGNGASGTTLYDSGIALAENLVYTFSITVHPVAGTYNAATNYPTWDGTITAGASSYTMAGMRFRNNALTSGRYLQFGGGNNNVERLAYSLDDLSISTVPEPATLGAMVLGFVILRGRRSGSRRS